MTKKDYPLIIIITLLDFLLLNLSILFFILHLKEYNIKVGEPYFYLMVFFNFVWIITNFINKYKINNVNKFSADVTNTSKKTFFLIGLMSIFAFSIRDFQLSRLIIYGSILAFFILQVTFHYIIFKLASLYWRREKSQIRIVIVGAGPVGNFLFHELTKNKSLRHYKILGFLDDNKIKNKNESHILGKLMDAKKIFARQKVDELIIALPFRSEERIIKLVQLADFYGIRVRMIPDFFKLFGDNFNVYTLGNTPIVNINEGPLDNYFNALLKRIFDICFSLLILILFSPVFLITALLINFTSKGPTFYRPERVGYKNNTFKVFKFRTMHHTNENDEKKSTIKDDPRVISIGRFLRKYNLDEIPQFINVIKGDMSVVGPRPHRIYLDKELQYSVDKYMIRHYIKPGLSGWAQVNGWRGPTHTKEQREQRTKHDLWYLRNWTFWLDMKIIWKTVFGKKSRTNAF